MCDMKQHQHWALLHKWNHPRKLKKKRKRQQCSFSHASWFLRKPKRLEKPTSWLWLLLASPCVFMIVLFILVPSSFCCETSLSSSQHLPICANQRPPFYVVSWLSHAEYCWNILKGPHPSISAEGLKFQPIASSKPWDISDIPSGYGSRMVNYQKKWRFLYVKCPGRL
jgi:hypothetical protein